MRHDGLQPLYICFGVWKMQNKCKANAQAWIKGGNKKWHWEK
jgi:hypothetical protein